MATGRLGSSTSESKLPAHADDIPSTEGSKLRVDVLAPRESTGLSLSEAPETKTRHAYIRVSPGLRVSRDHLEKGMLNIVTNEVKTKHSKGDKLDSLDIPSNRNEFYFGSNPSTARTMAFFIPLEIKEMSKKLGDKPFKKIEISKEKLQDLAEKKKNLNL